MVVGRRALGAGVPVTAGATAVVGITATNLWLLWRVRGGAEAASRSTVGLFVCADVALIFWVLVGAGGVLNPASIFCLVEIVVAALVLGPAWTWVVTGLSVAGYAALFLGQPEPLVAAQGMHPEIASHMEGMWLAFAGTALIVGVLVTRLALAVARRDRELEALRERDARSSRLAGLATVVAGAAHELSTPLSTMAVAARELERAAAAQPGAGALVDDAQLIRREVDRCRRVLDGMAGRIAEPMGEASRGASLVDLQADVIGRLAPDERARLAWHAAAESTVVWPLGVVGQAVANLVRNGFQASAAPDVVSVVCDLVDPTTVRIVVRDQGRGMAPDELARAGEPFFTTKPIGSGTGLGVFTARSAIERLGGSLELASAPGRGTTATITLQRRV